jgi:hypothetical protein
VSQTYIDVLLSTIAYIAAHVLSQWLMRLGVIGYESYKIGSCDLGAMMYSLIAMSSGQSNDRLAALCGENADIGL